MADFVLSRLGRQHATLATPTATTTPAVATLAVATLAIATTALGGRQQSGLPYYLSGYDSLHKFFTLGR